MLDTTIHKTKTNKTPQKYIWLSELCYIEFAIGQI